jgi:hypothetical protein
MNFIASNLRQSYLPFKTSALDLNAINGCWDCDSINYEFDGVRVKKRIKNPHIQEQYWRESAGVFFIFRAKYDRYIINILWNSNLRESLIIDDLSLDKMTVTNMFSRNVSLLTLTSRQQDHAANILHDASSTRCFTLAEIKQKFGYTEMPMLLMKNTEYYHFDDSIKGLTFIIHKLSFDCVKLHDNYNKIVFDTPYFIDVDRTNRVAIELRTLGEPNY